MKFELNIFLNNEIHYKVDLLLLWFYTIWVAQINLKIKITKFFNVKQLKNAILTLETVYF